MSPYPVYPPDGRGRIYISARCAIDGTYRECELLDANAASHVALVQPLHTWLTISLPYNRIASLALRYADGTIIQAFGSPIAKSISQVIQYAEVS